MSYAPIANFMIYGIHLAVYLGALTFTSLIITVTLGMLVYRGKAPFPWHVNMARTTVAIALIHITVVYLTFF